MANSVNLVVLLGNLTRDPELRYTTNGTPVAEFGLALNRSFNDKEETTFVDVTVWSKLAELCAEYLNKGRQVYLQGRLQLDTWESKEDGSKRSKLVVIGEDVRFLGGTRKDLPEEVRPSEEQVAASEDKF